MPSTLKFPISHFFFFVEQTYSTGITNGHRILYVISYFVYMSVEIENKIETLKTALEDRFKYNRNKK